MILDPNTWYPSKPSWHNLRCCRIQNKVAAIKLPLTDLSHFRIFTTITFKLGRPTLVRPDLVSLYIRHIFPQQNSCILWIYRGAKFFATLFWIFLQFVFFGESVDSAGNDQWPVVAWGRVGWGCLAFFSRKLEMYLMYKYKICLKWVQVQVGVGGVHL